MMKKGFTLIEALISILIVGFAFVTISDLQIGSLARLGVVRAQIRHIYSLEKAIMSKYLEPELEEKKQSEADPKIVLSLGKIADNSSLKEFGVRLKRLEAKTNWLDASNTYKVRSLNMVSFISDIEKK